ncbi:hypothetical protein [Hwangdonia sp.]|uniref:hypothetical protein n=1 Tax=Hwangdonia sp. TaxID=1883432 RepID=UPI003AB19C0D
MAPKSLKHQIIYGLVTGLIYAGFIAIVEYYKDKEFNLQKFIVGFILFGIGMIIVVRIKHKKDK